MRQISWFIALAILVCFTGCKEESTPTKETKTVRWYTDHPDERKAQLAICANNPGELRDDPNCINARQSFLRNSGGSVKNRI